MPYCPECRDEFEGRVKICPDCNVALVEKLPFASPKHKEHDDPLVHIATAPNEPLAVMWTEILENEGIHSLIKSSDLKAAMYVPSLLSPSEIYVLVSKAKEAKEILAPLLQDNQ